MEIASARLCVLGRHECIVKTLNTNIDEKLHVCGFDNDEHIRACRVNLFTFNIFFFEFESYE